MHTIFLSKLLHFNSRNICNMNLHVAIANTHHHHRHLLIMPSSYKYNNNSQDSWVKNESNFDTNMVIILAALLSVLICALLLNSIIRCAMRCSTSFSTNETSVRLAATGLKKHELMKIPVAVYGSGENIAVTECPICLGEFENGDKVRMLPKCNHGFHKMCIDTWLVTHSSCPNCRHSLLSVEKSSTRVCCVDGNNDTRAAGDRLPEGNLVVVVE